jgi:hypothetical protein
LVSAIGLLADHILRILFVVSENLSKLFLILQEPGKIFSVFLLFGLIDLSLKQLNLLTIEVPLVDDELQDRLGQNVFLGDIVGKIEYIVELWIV